MANYTKMMIDAVYTWVDGSDPTWQAQRAAARQQAGLPDDSKEPGFADRYVQHGELQWSLKNLVRYAPWIRRVFIVTMQQVPPDLPDELDVTIIDHKSILPDSALPTFNSFAIETALHLIPDLAEHFIYFNDDMFIGQPVTPEDFFDARGRGVLPWKEHKTLNHNTQHINSYESALFFSGLLVAQQHGFAHAAQYCRYPAHTAVPKTKSSLARLWTLFPQEMQFTQEQKFRVFRQVIHYLSNYLDLISGTAVLVGGEAAYFATDETLQQHWSQHRSFPKLFCVNQVRTARFAEIMQLPSAKPRVLKIRRHKF
jgi:hypothetical protein